MKSTSLQNDSFAMKLVTVCLLVALVLQAVLGLKVSCNLKLKRKIKDKKAQLNSVGAAMSGTKVKSTFVMILTTVAVFAILGSAYEGEIVLKLPFEPISFIRGMSHRGIETEDFYHCSFLFVYILGNMCVRPAVTKFLGFEPPKGTQKSMFTPPSLDEDEE